MDKYYFVVESEAGLFDVCRCDEECDSAEGAEVIREGFDTEHDANMFIDIIAA